MPNKSSARIIFILKIVCWIGFFISIALLVAIALLVPISSFIVHNYYVFLLVFVLILTIFLFMSIVFMFIWYRFYTLPDGKKLVVKGRFGKIIVFYDGYIVEELAEDTVGIIHKEMFVNLKMDDSRDIRIYICRRVVTLKLEDKIIGCESIWQ